jgi:hypothetical protein
MPSITGRYTMGSSGYADIIICKWVTNGVDYFDTSAKATSDCSKAGTSYGLWSTGYLQTYQTTPTNDQAMIKKYISSIDCTR